MHLNAKMCLYIYREGSHICLLVIYIDDFILAASSHPLMDKIKMSLSNTFKMCDLGPVTYILGIQIKQNCKVQTISLCQEQYIKTVVERCGMKDSKLMWTPMVTRAKLTAKDPKSNITITDMEIGSKRVLY